MARLGWYWWLSGHRGEGSNVSRDVLAMTGDMDPADRAVAFGFAALNGLEGAADIDEVRLWFQEADRLAAGPGFQHPALRLIGALTALFTSRGEQASFELIEALFTDPDPWLRAIAKMMSSQVRLNYGQSADLAEAEMRDALDGFRALGERWGIGWG